MLKKCEDFGNYFCIQSFQSSFALGNYYFRINE